MASFKIATWNMGHWQRTGKHAAAWQFLREVVAPNVALIQEAVPPPGIPRVVYRPGGIDANRAWASLAVPFAADIMPTST